MKYAANIKIERNERAEMQNYLDDINLHVQCWDSMECKHENEIMRVILADLSPNHEAAIKYGPALVDCNISARSFAKIFELLDAHIPRKRMERKSAAFLLSLYENCGDNNICEILEHRLLETAVRHYECEFSRSRVFPVIIDIMSHPGDLPPALVSLTQKYVKNRTAATEWWECEDCAEFVFSHITPGGDIFLMESVITTCCYGLNMEAISHAARFLVECEGSTVTAEILRAMRQTNVSDVFDLSYDKLFKSLRQRAQDVADFAGLPKVLAAIIEEYL